MDPSMQICEPRLEICLVVLPRHAVHSGSSLAFERVVRRAKGVDRNVMQKRGELLLLPAPCGVPYAAQRLGHTVPALSPECALLVSVPLGLRPWLHRLRRRSRGFVRRLPSYYARVRLLLVVHRQLRLLAFLPRTIRPKGRMPTRKPPGSRARSVRTCQGLRPRRRCATRGFAPPTPTITNAR